MRKCLRVGLAVAVWAAGTWGIHTLLPVAPRVEWPVPGGCRVEAVTSDGIAIVIHGPLGSDWDAQRTGPVEGWDIRTGRRLWSVLGPDDEVRLKLDAGQVVIHHYRVGSALEEGGASQRLDARSGREIARWRFPALMFDGFYSLLPDGRTAFDFHLFANGSGENRLIDAPSGRTLRSFPAGYFWLSAGKRFVAIDEAPPLSTGVWELHTGRLVGRCPVQPNGNRDGPESLSADGRLLLDIVHTLWDVPTGTVRFKTDALQSYFTTDEQRLVVHRFIPDVGCALCWLDIESGREDVSRRLVLLLGTDGWADTERAADRRLTCLVTSERPAGWLARQLAALHPSLAPLAQDHVKHWRVIVDPETARVVVRYPGDDPYLGLTADGTGVITGGPTVSRVRIWDIPPRKSLRWLVGLSAGWGALVGLVARWWGRWAGRRVQSPPLAFNQP